jgi:hypothetical protein
LKSFVDAGLRVKPLSSFLGGEGFGVRWVINDWIPPHLRKLRTCKSKPKFSLPLLLAEERAKERSW